MLIRNDPALEAIRSAHDDAVHTRERYRRSVVRERLVAAGLMPVSVSYRLAELTPFIALHRLARRWWPRHAEEEAASDVYLLHPWMNRALLATLRFDNRMLERFSLPFGTSVFAVARRPLS